MTSGYLLIYTLLLSLILLGLLGLFVFKEYVKKISCLSVSYSSFLILIVLLSLKNGKSNDIFVIMVSVLVIFAVNLLIGIGIARSAAKKRSDK